jgi:hypothetical protein
MEAFNRRDLDVAVSPGTSDFEYIPPREFVEAGFTEPCYRGPAGYRKFVSAWSDVFGPDFRVQDAELIDLGDHIVMLADLPWRGQASGVSSTGQIAWVSVLKDGRAIRTQTYLNHSEALEAAGLRE